MQLPTAPTSLDPIYEGFVSSEDPTPGVVDASEADKLQTHAMEIGLSKVGCCFAKCRARKKAKELVKELVLAKPSESFTRPAILHLRSFCGLKGPIGTDLLWKAERPTEHYHWWPMKETSRDADDPRNNLFAKSGGLGKYDVLFGTDAVDYQRENHFRPYNSDSKDAGWAGFCDRATTLGCLYQRPKHSVTVQVGDKSETLKPRDIEMLMIVAQDRAVERLSFEFFGERNDGHEKDDVGEPYPSKLLKYLKRITRNNMPFAMDIEKGSAVWNYAFDSVEVKRYVEAPSGWDTSDVPTSGVTDFVEFTIESAGFDHENQKLRGWVNIADDGNVTEGWTSERHPDFIWQYKALSGSWSGQCQLNPEVDAGHVYAIYQKALEGGGTLRLA